MRPAIRRRARATQHPPIQPRATPDSAGAWPATPAVATVGLGRAVLALALVGLALRLAFALLPLSVHLLLLEDDAWMVTAIARHFALGHGITADGLTPTNGFQPLYPLTLGALPYLVAPDALDAGFTANLLICAVLSALTVWPLWWLARHFGGPWAGLVATALFALNPLVVVASVNAMETALGLLLLLTLLVGFYRLDQRRWRNLLLLALLTATAVLARLDAALAFAAIGLTMLLQARQQPGGLSAVLPRAAVYAGTTMLLLAPYFAFNYSVSGTFGPSSGAALTYMHSFREEYALSNGLKGLFLNSAINLGWVPSALPLLLLLLLGAALVIGLLGRRLLVALPLLLYLPVPLLYYGYLLQQFKPRYFLGVSAILIILLAWAAAAALRRWPGRWPTLALAGATTALLALNLAGALANYRDQLNQPEQTQPTAYRAALWARDNLPPGALIGAKNSGIYQYYSGHTVLNIDGKLNHEILPAMQERRLLDYLRAHGIVYLIDREQTMADHIMFYSAEFGPAPAHHAPSLAERAAIYGKMAAHALGLGPLPDLPSPRDFRPSQPFSSAATIVATFARPNTAANPVVIYQLRPTQP